MAIRPGGQMLNTAIPTRSQLLPILTKYKELPHKSQLIPALVTILVIMLLFAFSQETKPIIVARGKNPLNWFYSSYYILVLGCFLVFMSLQFLYSLAGKAKSWWGLLGVMGFSMIFMQYGGFDLLYPLFYGIAGEPADTDTLGISLWKHFVGTGFLEEFTKAIPLLLLAYFSANLTPDQRRKFGIEEPLDGILLGAASAGGFVLIETLGQYVPTYLAKFWLNLALNVTHAKPTTYEEVAKLIGLGSSLSGTAPGLQLLIPRGLRACFGHMAYSGYLGYFIGLAILKPQKRVRILSIGFLSASFVHALWDTIPGELPKILIAVTCYSILTAAILKARELSPNRALLGPSVLFGYSSVTPMVTMQQHAAPAPAPPPPPPPPAANQPLTAYPVTNAITPNYAIAGGGQMPMGLAAAPPQAVVISASRTLRIGFRQFAAVAGLQIPESQASGMQAQQPGGIVAQVVPNPSDPNVLGLTNMSRATWEVMSPSGNRYSIQPWQTVKLSPGTKIDFGNLDGEVR